MIDGINIKFPYRPYPAQHAYMRKVIATLNGKGNAILESPTGTGKTLCLLCASLAWLAHQRLNEIINPKCSICGKDINDKKMNNVCSCKPKNKFEQNP